jgi:hypothetical protein
MDNRENTWGDQIAFGAFSRVSALAAAAHFFEQYFTRSQSRSHFFRQAKSRLLWGQVVVGK